MFSQLRAIALESGLQAVGVAPIIDEVREVFPWAKSVITAAACYLPPEQEPEDDRPRGLVARFARSGDYHTVMRAKLFMLANAIKETHSGTLVEVCVDTVPLPERKLAVLGGIASRGKNGNVFVDGCGSYASLGELVTNIQIEEPSTINQREFEICGDCNICAKACPTGAIVAPGMVDSTKCISQLTQMSGMVPRELRNAIGCRIYGCDVCQEVCPRNIETKPLMPEFADNIFPGAYSELIPLLNLSSDDFNKTVKGSSIGWIRKTRIKRNAILAAGNLKREECIAPLIQLLSDVSPIIRAHAAWALGETKSEQTTQALTKAAALETELEVLGEIRASLANTQT